MVKLTGTLGLYSEAWRTVPLDSSVLILRQQKVRSGVALVGLGDLSLQVTDVPAGALV